MGFVSGQHLFLFLIFLAIVLIVFGPGKLPEVGSGLGKAIREFRHASTEAKDQLMNAVDKKDESPAAAAQVTDSASATASPVLPGTVTAPPQPVAGGSTKTRVGG